VADPARVRPRRAKTIARLKAEDARQLLRDGKDPIKVKRDAVVDREQTLAKWLDAAYDAAGVRQTRAHWTGPVQRYVLPKLGKTPVAAIDANDLYHVLKPVWRKKEHTARVALARVGLALEQAVAAKLDVDLSAVGSAKIRLGKKRKATVRHHNAMPYPQVPAFIAALPDKPAGWALGLLILPAVRSDNARTAHVDEFDLEAGVWTIPGHKMKTGVELRVPLSTHAAAVVRRALPTARNGYLFPPTRGSGDTVGKRAIPAITEKLTDNQFKTHVFWTCHGFVPPL